MTFEELLSELLEEKAIGVGEIIVSGEYVTFKQCCSPDYSESAIQLTSIESKDFVIWFDHHLFMHIKTDRGTYIFPDKGMDVDKDICINFLLGKENLFIEYLLKE